MGLFKIFSTNLAIDLGTANTLIMADGEILLDEPSIIAIDKSRNKVIAVGKQAMLMHEKTHESIKTIRPLKDGVIADFSAAEEMIRGMIQMMDINRGLFSGANNMIICIPSGITEVEKRAVKDSAQHAGAKSVFMVSEPIAAAVGIKIEIDKPVGCMVVDIGGGTTEIAIIALSGIVCNQSIRIAGDTFNQEIVHHMRQKHNLLIGERTGEEIKIAAGACVEKLNEEVADYEVRGRDLMTGIPEVVKVSYKEIAISLDKSISKIEDAILKALEIAPPELSSDIYLNGIHLTGGGALLRGLNTRIEQKTKLKVHIAEDPLRAVVRGTGIISQNLNKFKAVLLS